MASGVVKHPYTAPTDGNKGNFLELKLGDRIDNIKLLDGGWWYGTATSSEGDTKGSSGYFPSTYVTLNERGAVGKHALYDGGALRRSLSKNLARQQSTDKTEDVSATKTLPGGGTLARKSSINKLRMMAYGTTSDLVESRNISLAKKSSIRVSADSNHKIKSTIDKRPRRLSATAPIEFVNERIMQGEVHDFVEEDEVSPTTPAPASQSGVVITLKDDATNSHFTFADGVYAWVSDD